jgi:catechol 2,3-dioxygenase-like lactoylglutathione lyase family enzyme
MKVMPIRYVADVTAATRFYAALGLVQGDSSRSGNWTELNGSGGTLALHTARTEEQDPPGRVELSFETQEPLETLAERLTAAGFEPEAIVDENFGRSLRVIDPDGVLVQVNEHDRELYT